MNEVIQFNHPDFGQINPVVINNEPWFVASEICAALGIVNPSRAISSLDEDEKNTLQVMKGIKGNPNRNIVSESGFYKLVFKSQKENAKLFQKWVTSEVLPSIRKHGAYMTSQKIEEVLTDPDTIIQLATNLKKEQIANREKQRIIDEQKPKVLFAEAVEACNTSILIRDLAKILNQNGIDTGEKRLFKWLRENGYLIKKHGSDYNSPTQKSMNLGLFEIKESIIMGSDGKITIRRTPKVKGKGQTYFTNKFLNLVVES